LVYATALRQVGDSTLAEEITQNVFITLARKSPALRGVTTLAGWLHRTTIYESKTRIRSELRRRRREETAASVQELHREGEPLLQTLIPLLDEALLQLREGDRLALVLRYFEDRSFKDVGQTLGVDEDAARKRVSRALDRITEFFKRRGFVVSTTVATAAKQSHRIVPEQSHSPRG
jgi:RNA polymerase sigma factor (sigma-70 family)